MRGRDGTLLTARPRAALENLPRRKPRGSWIRLWGKCANGRGGGCIRRAADGDAGAGNDRKPRLMIPTRLCVLENLPPCAGLEANEHALFGPGLRSGAGAVPRRMTGDRSCCLLPRRCARHWFLPAAEDLDDAHGTAAAGHGSRRVSGVISGTGSGAATRSGCGMPSKARILVMLALRAELASMQ